MAKIGKVILIIYLTLATVGCALFGYLYFSKSIDESKDEMNISVKGIVAILSEDIKNLVQKQSVSTLSLKSSQSVSLLDAESQMSKIGIPTSEYESMSSDSGMLGMYYKDSFISNFSSMINYYSSKSIGKLTSNGNVVTSKVDLNTMEETEGDGALITHTAKYQNGHLYIYTKVVHDGSYDGNVIYMNIYLFSDLTLNETKDDYTQIALYSGPTENINNGETTWDLSCECVQFYKEDSELVGGYCARGAFDGDFDYQTENPQNYKLTNLRIQDFDYKNSLYLYAEWNDEKPDEGLLAKYNIKDNMYQKALTAFGVSKLVNEKISSK
ncbi:MAG: hypothetical protein ACI4T2_02470 [Christensenellales bacterium]